LNLRRGNVQVQLVASQVRDAAAVDVALSGKSESFDSSD
jgi:hypothetical protein